MSNRWDVREFEESDWDMLNSWSKAVGMMTPPMNILPDWGVIVRNKGVDCCLGFMYLANSCPVAVIEWVYFNPEISPRQKVESVKHVVSALEQCAKGTGHNVLFASSGFKGLTNIYERQGFTCANSGMSHLIKIAEE